MGIRSWLLTWLLWGPLANAAEVAVVGVHDADVGAEEQHVLATAISAAIDLMEGHTALRPDDVAKAIAGREELIVQQALMYQGRRALEDGRILYQQAQASEAVLVLEGARDQLEELIRYTMAVRVLWEANMFLGTAALAAGDEPKAREAIDEAVTLHPERRPDPATFPPSVIELYETSRSFLLDDPGSLSVVAPEGAEGIEVWMDGRTVGAPPMELTLPAGAHHLHARAADGRVAYAAVELLAGEAEQIEVELEQAELGRARDTLGQRSQQIGALYLSLGRFAEVPLLLLAGRVDDVMHLQLYAPEIAAFSEPVVLSQVGSQEEIIDGVVRLMGSLTPTGSLPQSDTTFVALPLDIRANRLLSSLLLVPSPPVAFAPAVEVTPQPVEPQGPGGDVKSKPKWPVFVGVGVGAAAVAAGITALAVALGGRGNGDEGVILIGPSTTAQP